MKIKGHQSFYIRRGWIHKGLVKISENENIFSDKSLVLTDEFGIGSNMVNSLKYWLETLGLIEKKRNGNKVIYEISCLGKTILEYDPYLEEVATWQLFQYKLATNKDLATTWYWFFNIYKGKIFNKENLFNNLKIYLNEFEKEVSERSLKDDISCLLNTYINKEITSPEDNLESPFSILKLIEVLGKNDGQVTYEKSACKYLDKYVAYYILLNIGKEKENNIDLKDVIYGENSIGSIFNMDSYKIMEVLEKIQNLGYIKIIRTNGLDYLSFISKSDDLEILKKIYN